MHRTSGGPFATGDVNPNVLNPIFAGSAGGEGEELNAIEPCDVF